MLIPGLGPAGGQAVAVGLGLGLDDGDQLGDLAVPGDRQVERLADLGDLDDRLERPRALDRLAVHLEDHVADDQARVGGRAGRGDAR